MTDTKPLTNIDDSTKAGKAASKTAGKATDKATHESTDAVAGTSTDETARKTTGEARSPAAHAAGTDEAATTDEVATTEEAASTDQVATTDDAATGDEAIAVPGPDSTKSAFEAAIERKKAAGQARSAHLDGGAKVGGATASHKTSRTFRRKSG